MLPTLAVGPFAVSSLTLMMLLAVAVGSWLGARQARHLAYDADHVWRMIPWAAGAGVLGAKLYYVAGFMGGLAADPRAAFATLRAGGMVWYGGAFAGVAVGVWRLRRTVGARLADICDYGAPCLAFGHAIGRVGCFLVGDDWGVPTSLPWAVAFPHGAPPSTAASLRAFGVAIPATVPADTVFAVHPTQLYEAAGLALLGTLLWRASRRPHAPWQVMSGYLLGYGALRFANECVRAKDDRLAIGLTVAQCISLALIAAGLWLRTRRASPTVAPTLADVAAA